ncbi:MAG TPA: NHLP family bacteriocin export ABC transporter peptidase/permease/ATPase subunit [Oscillatoriaceae cyanobacterium]
MAEPSPNSQPTAKRPSKGPIAASPRRVNTPTVLQMEAVECGAAALAMILAHYKKYLPLPSIRQACGVSRDGSKASNVLKAARGYGLEAKGYKKQIDEVFGFEPPFIAFWMSNHFLVVEGWNATTVFLNDPAGGKRAVSYDEFKAGFSEVMLTFKRTEAFAPGGEPPKIWPKILPRIHASRKELLFTTGAGLLLVLPSLAAPAFTQIFIDDILVKGYADWLRPMLIGMGLSALLTFALSALQLRVQNLLKTKLEIAMTGQFLWHVLRLPVGFYAQRFAGEVAGRVQIADKAAAILGGPITTALLDGMMVFFYALAMLAYDPVLGAIATLLAAANFGMIKLIAERQERVFMKTSIDRGKAMGVAIEGLQSIETLKAGGIENDFFARWSGYYTRGINSQQGNLVFTQVLGVLPTLLVGLGNLAVLTIGGLRVMEGHLTIGTLIGFQTLMGSFMAPVGRLIGLGTSLTELKADLMRLDDVLGTATDRGAESPQPVSPETSVRLSGRIELRNVTFGYSPTDPPLIENLNLVLEPGQHVAFVGGSGSGKSTVAKLIMGLYEPWSGEILFDGRPRETIPRAVLLQSLAMVDQDLFLFSGSVRDNLALWDETVTDAELTRACEDAAILDIVAGLTGGMDAVLKEGATNLSGGQRQRLEIARAVIRDPAVLVLDEATSALDSESERLVGRSIRQRGCTCVIVAHRLSTIRDADEIIVLANGKVSQRGTHEQLREETGHYANLIRAEGGVLEATSA